MQVVVSDNLENMMGVKDEVINILSSKGKLEEKIKKYQLVSSDQTLTCSLLKRSILEKFIKTLPQTMSAISSGSR